MLSGPEIQDALGAFVARWRSYTGSERAEAQTFLNQLFECYGSNRQEVGALFEDFKSSSGFMDLHWPGVAIFEMKAPGVPLLKAQDQRQRYWQESSDPANGIPSARWVVLCNFREFEVWEPGRFPTEPRATFSLDELPDRYDALLFLQSPNTEPVFAEHRRSLTTEAVSHVAQLYTSLADRAAAPIDEIQRFTMQIVWCLFAEDLGMLDSYPLQSTVNELLTQAQPDSARDIGYLFELLNQKGDQNRHGRYAGTRYVNGELFAKPAKVYLDRSELLHLKQAAEFDWRAVDPTIFGSLMEGVLGEERRERLGAHYTHEADILKIVVPTIVRPWRERIDASTSAGEARALLDELCTFRVLDPACGCGNFLYVAYRELRGLEHELKQRVADFSVAAGHPVPVLDGVYYPITNVYGIDIENIAVLIARVTLWMGHRQMVDRYGPAEPVLPLVSLTNLRSMDALKSPWPEVDAIIGNPPFWGSQRLRKGLGDEYVAWLDEHFRVGIKDLCVYWFRKANDQLKPGQRAGLVGTNSISQNRARSASLEYIVQNGGVITDAVSTERWPGDAKVHVSIVNWVKSPANAPAAFDLDGSPVGGITTSLKSGSPDDWRPQALGANRGHCFQGPIPVGRGFVLDESTARKMLASKEADYSTVVRPYLDSEDIADDPHQAPRRWVIDFNVLPLEAASKYPEAMKVVRESVKPERDRSADRGFRSKWWQFGRPRGEMRVAINGLQRYFAVGRHGKRMFIAVVAPIAMASDATNVFAFDDGYSLGVLLSRAHDAWAWSRSSTLETRLRYTPSTVFETFPWPDATEAARATIAAASAALYERRTALCAEHNIGLTKLYNLMDEGGFADLRELHRKLDVAVAAAYGWPASVAQDGDELVRRLTELNRRIATGEIHYNPFNRVDVTL